MSDLLVDADRRTDEESLVGTEGPGEWIDEEEADHCPVLLGVLHASRYMCASNQC